MTFLDVLDDAVKIGFGGISAWLIAKGSRAHEFEKERRRRKQDCVEQAIENLAEQISAHDGFCLSSLSYGKSREMGNHPELEKVLATNVKQSRAQSNLALTKLDRSRIKLIAFGFDECAASLQVYRGALLDFNSVLEDVRNSKAPEIYAKERATLRKSAESVRQALAKAFATL